MQITARGGSGFRANQQAKRKGALAAHADLSAKANLPALGRLYLDMLRQGVWASRRAISADLGVSRGMIQRRIALAMLPDEVVAAFGGYEFMSSRTVKAVEGVLASIGAEQIKANAVKMSFEAKRSVAKTLAFLATGTLPS
jgi:hypothetical protein